LEYLDVDGNTVFTLINGNANGMRLAQYTAHIFDQTYLYFNGKLSLRTFLECSVPEPYRSPDWALVPAKTGPKAEY
jgi:hypothetical protein